MKHRKKLIAVVMAIVMVVSAGTVYAEYNTNKKAVPPSDEASVGEYLDSLSEVEMAEEAYWAGLGYSFGERPLDENGNPLPTPKEAYFSGTTEDTLTPEQYERIAKGEPEHIVRGISREPDSERNGAFSNSSFIPVIGADVGYEIYDENHNLIEQGVVRNGIYESSDSDLDITDEEVDGEPLRAPIMSGSIPGYGYVRFYPSDNNRGFSVSSGQTLTFGYKLSGSRKIEPVIRNGTNGFPGTIVSYGYVPYTGAEFAYGFKATSTGRYIVQLDNHNSSSVTVNSFIPYIARSDPSASDFYMNFRP